MQNLVITLAAMLVLALAGLAWMGWRLRALRQRPQAAAPAPAGRLESELEMLASTSVGMGQRLDRTVAEIRALSQRLEQFETRDPGSNAYMHAIRMAERGKDVDELMEVFGVSRAEAELIRKLHPEKSAARH